MGEQRMVTGAFRIVAHADWSISPSKRWVSMAILQPDGRYLCQSPQRVIEPPQMLSGLGVQAGAQGSALAGFDFPIGLPLAYAQRTGITGFLSAFPQLGMDAWSSFYDPARTPEEISLYRPFYPAKAGRSTHRHLIDGLGVKDIDALRRRCELPHPGRRSACPLFWTLGAQQVGKAAISGWKEALSGPEGFLPFLSIWPFSGRLEALVHPGQVVVAETYPAECYSHLGLRFSRRRGQPSGKRLQADRKANAPALSGWAEQAGVTLTPALQAAIQDGFGPSPDGEDPFDAAVGLFGMLNVILGRQPVGEPEDEAVRNIEGWILGQQWITGSGYTQAASSIKSVS